MLRRFAVAAALAGIAATAAPAHATLRYCQEPVDVGCFSQSHDMQCLVYVHEWCVNLPNLPSRDGPVCAFHPICDDIDDLINSGSTRNGTRVAL